MIEVVLFVIGTIVGGVLVTGIVLPLFHSLPRSIYWIAKGKLKPRACLTYIWVFFAWTGALVVAVLIVDWLFPQARVYLYNSAGFFYGQWFGLIWYLAISLSKSGRQRLRENFWDEMKGCLSSPEGDFIDKVRSGMVKTGAMTREEAERLITLDMLRDHVSLPQGEVEIVGEYGRVLAELPGPLRPLSKLPYPKETIRRAIETLLSRSRDPEYRNHLETALLVLDDFVPDEEVPLDEEENTRKWLTSRNRPFASSGSANHMKGNSPMSEENGPIFQVPSQAVEMKVAIHFYKERKASILLNVDSTGAARNFCEVQFFAFYLLRQLTTLDNPADDMLAYIMANTSTLDIRQIASDIEVIPYPGYEAEKQLFADCALRPDTSSFYFNVKGFDWLMNKIDYYSPASVLVFLQTLALQHANEESYLTKLKDACRLSALFHSSKQLTMANQSEMAFMIGGTLLSESTLDD